MVVIAMSSTLWKRSSTRSLDEQGYISLRSIKATWSKYLQFDLVIKLIVKNKGIDRPMAPDGLQTSGQLINSFSVVVKISSFF